MRRKNYNEVVRYYTKTNVTSGGITLKCIFCGYTVATLDFDVTKGNRRTQAAAAINQHAKEMHSPQVRTAEMKSGSRGAL